MEKENALLDKFCPNTTQIVDDRDILYQQILQDAIANEELKTHIHSILGSILLN
jgi:hypothetical protein